MTSVATPSLHFVFAQTCHACTRVKQGFPEIERKLKEAKIPYFRYDLPSTSSNPVDSGVPATLARVTKWFPTIALLGADGTVLAVFNAESDGMGGVKHTTGDAKFPNAENILAFYNANKLRAPPAAAAAGPSTAGPSTLALQAPPPSTPLAGTTGPVVSGNRATGFIPTAACRTGFKGRLV